ncbi:MAG: DUF2332 family protein [Actinomycetota bacterium]
MNSWESTAKTFETHDSPAYAAIARSLAEEPEPGLTARPLVALAAVRRAALEGRATDPHSGDADAMRADSRRLYAEIAERASTGLVQYTDPCRLGDTIPGMLIAARWYPGLPLRIVDLGTSAGMLLLASSMALRFPTGSWDPDGSLAAIDSAMPVPGQLLETSVTIESAVGIDINPLDVRDPEAVLTLRSFEWPGPAARGERLATGVRVAQQRPPTLIAGDVPAVATDVLRHRLDRESVTVVIDSAFSHYLPMPAQIQLGRTLDRLSGMGNLVLITRGAAEEGRSTVRAVDLSHKRRLVYAETDFISEAPRWLDVPIPA